jgi:Arc/MetJ family transcription regulator
MALFNELLMRRESYWRGLRHQSRHQMTLPLMLAPAGATRMRTTINIDESLLAKTVKFAGPLARSAVVHEGLKALIERETARRLARLGGSQPALKAAPRRRAGAKA